MVCEVGARQSPQGAEENTGGDRLAPRCADGEKPSLAAVDTFPGRKVDAPLVESAYVWLECSLREILDGLGPNSLVIGDVVAAAVHEDALREADRDDADQIHLAPLLAYLSPGRIATIDTSTAFPFHRGFSR